MKYKWLSLAALMVVTPLSADLQPISDSAMSEVTGQAFVSVDRQHHPDETNSTSFTRVNLGMEIDIQSNIDTLELGRYDREGEKPGTADVLIDDFALGYINNRAFFDRNPKAARQRKRDGSAFAENEIVPFQIDNPFFEFAMDEDSQEIVGFRLGFGKAMGMLSGKIETLTGNVNVDIIDKGQGLSNANSNGNFFDQAISFLAPLLTSGDPISAKAQLVHGAEGDPNIGELDPVRAEHIGIPNGKSFVIEGANGFVRTSLNLLGGGLSSEFELPGCGGLFCGGGDVIIEAQDCAMLGIDVCFDLDNFNSFPIGEIEEVGNERRIVAPADGAFISVQTKDLDWLEDVSKTNPTADDFIRATSGAFFNIPNGATEVNLNQALNGTERVRTEYIDRGRGLF